MFELKLNVNEKPAGYIGVDSGQIELGDCGNVWVRVPTNGGDGLFPVCQAVGSDLACYLVIPVDATGKAFDKNLDAAHEGEFQIDPRDNLTDAQMAARQADLLTRPLEVQEANEALEVARKARRAAEQQRDLAVEKAEAAMGGRFDDMFSKLMERSQRIKAQTEEIAGLNDSLLFLSDQLRDAQLAAGSDV